jgi:hypothetical protein
MLHNCIREWYVATTSTLWIALKLLQDWGQFQWIFFTVQPYMLSFIVNSGELKMRTLNYAVICLCCTGSTKSFIQMADIYRLIEVCCVTYQFALNALIKSLNSFHVFAFELIRCMFFKTVLRHDLVLLRRR